MGKTLSDEDLSEEIHRVAEEVGRAPTYSEMQERAKYSLTAYRGHFGSWTEARKAAGYTENQILPGQRLSEDQLLEELRTAAGQVEGYLTTKEFDELSEHSASTAQKKFGSWEEALECAGLETREYKDPKKKDLVSAATDLAEKIGRTPSVNQFGERTEYNTTHVYNHFNSWEQLIDEAGLEHPRYYRITREELLEEIQRLEESLGHPPSQREMKKQGEFSPATYEQRFDSWNNALRELGYEPHQEYTSSKELLEDLREFANDLGKPPTNEQMNNSGPHSNSRYQDRFGSWNQALRNAGLEPPIERNLSDEELLVRLAEFAEKLDHTPSADEMTSDGPVSSTVYAYRFGSWNAALRKAGLSLNHELGIKEDIECNYCGTSFKRKPSEIGERNYCSRDCRVQGMKEIGFYEGENNPNWRGGKSQTSYGGNWGKYREKRRKIDQYQCQDCGMVQKTHLQEYGTHLHVHHIIKYEKFDDPEKANQMDNLVTLCARCHKKWEGIPLRPQ